MSMKTVSVVIHSILLILLLVKFVQPGSLESLQIPGTRSVLKSRGEGAPNGTIFDDVANVSASIFNVHVISIMSMYQVDFLQFTYQLANGSLYRAPAHGDGIFYPENITLEKDEFIEKIEGSTSYELINQLTFTISRPNKSQKRVIGPYGTTVGKHNFTFEGYIFGFHGKTGRLLQNLGVYYLAPVKKSQYFGYPCTVNFMEQPDAMFPPVIKISRIFISHGDLVNSIQFEYQLHGGGTRLGGGNGGGGRNSTIIDLKYGEGLIGIDGRFKGGIFHRYYISQLSFITRTMNGSIAVYGPFGNRGDKPFSVFGNIIGYMGKAKKTIESLGVFYY